MKHRVSNEQAIDVKNMVNGRPFIYAAGNDIPADWFAADLLEARDLLRDVIKGLECIYCLDVNPATTELSNATRWSLCSRKAIELLAKTKDYAE